MMVSSRLAGIDAEIKKKWYSRWKICVEKSRIQGFKSYISTLEFEDDKIRESIHSRILQCGNS